MQNNDSPARVERVRRAIKYYATELFSPLALLGAVRNGLISSVVATLITLAWTYHLELAKTRFYVIAESGIGSPALLFAEANDEGEYQFTFNPPDLQRTRFCRYFFSTGRSFGELALEFLKINSDCFIARATGDKFTFDVSPNNFSGFLSHNEKDGLYWCNCPSAITGG